MSKSENDIIFFLNHLFWDSLLFSTERLCSRTDADGTFNLLYSKRPDTRPEDRHKNGYVDKGGAAVLLRNDGESWIRQKNLSISN